MPSKRMSGGVCLTVSQDKKHWNIKQFFFFFFFFGGAGKIFKKKIKKKKNIKNLKTKKKKKKSSVHLTWLRGRFYARARGGRCKQWNDREDRQIHPRPRKTRAREQLYP
ncbi:hypothetical protein [Neisseria gonorrhoeae]|uniref:hypothetical protein n=1 Tax=Neisseria gonorrhoeae TaxID=485 RepID=UPI00161C75D5|nr:hypothetical protein [Neisseria gonorrhoeae]